MVKEEKTFDMVKVFAVGHPDSHVVTIPVDLRRKLGIKLGDRFLVKVDSEGRIIYEKVK